MKSEGKSVKRYPINTANVVLVDSLILQDKKSSISEYMSTRMVKAANMCGKDGFVGWQMIVPAKGVVNISVFSSSDFSKRDVEWIIENVATLKKSQEVKTEIIDAKQKKLYEIYLPIQNAVDKRAIGFNQSYAADPKTKDVESEFAKWPLKYSIILNEFIEALRETGGVFRAVVGKASVDEQLECKQVLTRTIHSGVDVIDYLGHPVKARFFVALPEKPSIRLLSVVEEAIPESEFLYVGELSDKKTANQWDKPLLSAPVLPDFAARIMLMEPMVYENATGIDIVEKPVKPIATSHKNVKDKNAIVIGRAIATTGRKRNINLGDADLKRHVQIIGQTGTGKSTMLTTSVHNALRTGHGCTLFDPHGTTVDSVLKTIPEKFKHKVRVVRIGDAENPVPLTIWDSDDPKQEERTISDMCELFSDIFDPKKQGIVGPRYEKWLSTFSKATIALFGRRASFESIALCSQNNDNMLLLYKSIVNKYPFIAETIRSEYGKDNSSDAVSTINWYLSKFQRLTSVEQLRKTLGAGTNALDFGNTLDTDTVTLSDLASPIIGANASRIVGTFIIMKLWNALMKRGQTDKTHIVVVDEASLFQTNPMPRMLAEGRKFGLSLVLCHQHTNQLSEDIREALEANSANFITFRLSAKDAYNASIRFDDESFRTQLTRLDAFKAIATLSVDGKQTKPFSLETVRTPQQKDGKRIAEEIERNSIETLVKPFKNVKALTNQEIMDILKRAEK